HHVAPVTPDGGEIEDHEAMLGERADEQIVGPALERDARRGGVRGRGEGGDEQQRKRQPHVIGTSERSRQIAQRTSSSRTAANSRQSASASARVAAEAL